MKPSSLLESFLPQINYESLGTEVKWIRAGTGSGFSNVERRWLEIYASQILPWGTELKDHD
jgi:hypothetical protein